MYADGVGDNCLYRRRVRIARDRTVERGIDHKGTTTICDACCGTLIKLRRGIDAHVRGLVAYVLSAPDSERRAAALLEGSRPDSADASHRDGECERRAIDAARQSIRTVLTVHAVAPRTAVPSTSRPNGERSHTPPSRWCGCGHGPHWAPKYPPPGWAHSPLGSQLARAADTPRPCDWGDGNPSRVDIGP